MENPKILELQKKMIKVILNYLEYNDSLQKIYVHATCEDAMTYNIFVQMDEKVVTLVELYSVLEEGNKIDTSVEHAIEILRESGQYWMHLVKLIFDDMGDVPSEMRMVYNVSEKKLQIKYSKQDISDKLVKYTSYDRFMNWLSIEKMGVQA